MDFSFNESCKFHNGTKVQCFLGWVRASGVCNCFSILLCLFSFSFFTYLWQRGLLLVGEWSWLWNIPPSVPQPHLTWPRHGMQPQHEPLSFFPVPHPWPAGVKKEDVLFHIIIYKTCTELGWTNGPNSVFPGMCMAAYCQLIPGNMLHFPWGYPETCIYFSHHLLTADLFSMFSLHVNFNNYNTLSLRCIHIGSEAWVRERWRKKKKGGA